MKTVVVNKYKEEFDIYIGRGSKWGNPFSIGKDGDREEVIEKYELWIRNKPELLNSLYELENKRLGCFCRPKRCHGDVLIKLLEEKKMNKKEALKKIEESVIGCTSCDLCFERNLAVFGEGSENADIMFLGEAPGSDENDSGRPFVGRAGKLLDKWLIDIGIKREEVYIANTVKCRPPNNRYPLPEELSHCLPYLFKQIEIIRPKAIITLGRAAFQSLVGIFNMPMGEARGHWFKYKDIPVMPTYHPSFLLRGMTEYKINSVKSDLREVKKLLEKKT